jgi:NAD(P)-dependent dehydrogenase (short-subunit alcohol dehydrogenase family)
MISTPTTIVITGATDGLGKALAGALSHRPGTRLILHGRNSERLRRLRGELADSAADITVVRADFAELAQVHQLVAQIGVITDHVSVLVNNAGVSPALDRQVSADRHELGFAVNYLAPFALTCGLLPLLQAGAPARVVNVASLNQTPVDFDDLALTRNYTRLRAYSTSKFALVSAGMTLAERLDPDVVTVNSLHPGTHMPTKMLDRPELSIDTIESGVRSTLRLILDPELTGLTGRFFNRTTDTQAHPEAYQADSRNRLWDVSEGLTTAPQFSAR